MAPAAGSTISFGLESSPSQTSRFSSNPTWKKKTAIKPSFIHNNRGLSMAQLPAEICTGRLTSWSYNVSRGELAIMRASIVAAISSMPGAASLLRKSETTTWTSSMTSSIASGLCSFDMVSHSFLLTLPPCNHLYIPPLRGKR